MEDLEEGEDEILNVAGWEPEVWEKMWSLAKQCLLRMTKRPSSTKVGKPAVILNQLTNIYHSFQ